MVKISELASLTVPANDDEIAIVDNAGVITKKIRRDDLLDGAPLPANTVDTQAITDASVTPDKMNFGAQTAFEDDSGTTTSAGYTSTLTSGGTNPSVSVTVPASGSVLVLLDSIIRNNSAGNVGSVSVALSGANTVAASDNNRIQYESGAANDLAEFGGHLFFTGLTPGTTTFTLQYKVNAGTGTFGERRLTVIPIGD